MATRLAWGNVLATVCGKRVAGCSIFVLGIGKCPLSPPPPQRELNAGLVDTQLGRRLNEQPEDHGTIIIGQFDKTSLGDQPTQFNQLSRARAPLHLPGPCVMPRLLQGQAMAGAGRAALLVARCRQRLGQARVRAARQKRTRRRVCAMPPFVADQ